MCSGKPRARNAFAHWRTEGEIPQLERKQLGFAAVGLGADLVDHGLRAFGRSAGDEYVSAMLCQLHRCHPAYARVRAGYERDFSG